MRDFVSSVYLNRIRQLRCQTGPLLTYYYLIAWIITNTFRREEHIAVPTSSPQKV